MRKKVIAFLTALLAAAGWYGHSKLPEGIWRRLLSSGGAAGGTLSSVPPIERTGNTVRMASFNIQVFGEKKLAKRDVAEVLARVIRYFDVVAIQEIRDANDDFLARFLSLVNADGSHYTYVIGPRLGRTNSKEQYAFIYNAASVECDRQNVYTVDDPDDLLHREPLVAGFRVRGPPPEQAFTFTLIDIHTDPDEAQAELNVLDDVFRAVRNDGRGEDDVILLGDLNSDDHHFGELGQVGYITWVITGMPTNTRGTHLYDNIVFDSRATVEYDRRAGVFDLMNEFHITMDDALAISDHLPIWAEFSLVEGGAGALASRQASRTVR
ncbi:MAG TPA: endonuclease/exonuclease/phosphatase family protein [Pirellulales bacterium]|nr:endonuclease/exonuclease/phosphatase family protein [Pirellulales bacterium]